MTVLSCLTTLWQTSKGNEVKVLHTLTPVFFDGCIWLKPLRTLEVHQSGIWRTSTFSPCNSKSFLSFFWADFYLHFGERCLVWLENLITFLTADSVEPSLLNWIIRLSIRQTFNTISPMLLSVSFCSFTCPLEMPQEKQLKDDISFK